ncbi:MAG: NUDIX hydrolase [Acidimicrobiia bacterium]
MNGPTDLTSVVERYVPSGDERSHRIAIDALETGRPMWPRSEFVPGHFTASGFVLRPDRTALLLIHHGKLDRWLQPGGHFEVEDETVEVGARREVAEETGLSQIRRMGSSLVRIDAHPIPERGDEPEHIHIDLAMGFIADSDEIGPIDEVLDARWVPFDQLDAYDTDDAVKRGVATLRSMIG